MPDDSVIRPLDGDEPDEPSPPVTPAPEEMLGALLDADAQPEALAPPEDFLTKNRIHPRPRRPKTSSPFRNHCRRHPLPIPCHPCVRSSIRACVKWPSVSSE